MNIVCEISGDVFRKFLIEIEKKYNIELKSNLNSTFDEIIDEIDTITDLVKESKVFIDYNNFWIFEELYKLFYIENSPFYSDNTEGYRNFVENEFKRVYIKTCYKGVPDSRDFFGEICDLNIQLKVALSRLKFEICYQNASEYHSKEEDILEQVMSEFNISSSYNYYKKLEYNKEDILESYIRDMEIEAVDFNGMTLNEFELYSELNTGCLSFDADSLSCFSASFKDPRAAEILSEILYEEEKAHIRKGKESLVRHYYGQDQIIINPELLVDGCYCVSTGSHHSLYIYEDYVKERQKAIGGE